MCKSVNSLPEARLLLLSAPGNGLGDACDGDMDGDGRHDEVDVCPLNNKIQDTDFREFQLVLMDPSGEAQIDPVWTVLNDVSSERYNSNDYGGGGSDDGGC